MKIFYAIGIWFCFISGVSILIWATWFTIKYCGEVFGFSKGCLDFFINRKLYKEWKDMQPNNMRCKGDPMNCPMNEFDGYGCDCSTD